jgi:hypothetical protein
MTTVETNWRRSMHEKCQPLRCHTSEHVANVPHPWMHHPTRSISHTFLWVVDDPWPTIECWHDSSPSYYW